MSREHQTTLYVVLLAGLGAALARETGRDDIVLGSPVANRPDRRLEALIGLFVNQVAIRIRVPGGVTFAALVAQVRESTLAALRHRDVPFARVVRSLAPRRSLTRTPV